MGGWLLGDTRQKVGHHDEKERWWAEHGVGLERVCLETGDYMNPADHTVTVDTKRGIAEVVGNVGRDHARFVRECDRAAASGLRLVVLVEEGVEYNDRSKLEQWRPVPCRGRCSWVQMPCPRTMRCKWFRRKPLQGSTVRRIIRTLERDHGVTFVFCDPDKAAQTVCDILGVDYDP